MDRTRLNALIGALVGTMTASALTAVLYLADVAGGLPFIPFDVFDWMTRTLPGGLIRFGVGRMVDLLLLLGLSVRDTAKSAEQIMAIAGLIVTCMVVAAALFAVLRRVAFRPGTYGGVLAGALLGVAVTLISLDVNQTATTGRLAGVGWIMIVFVGWGAAVGLIHDRLSGRQPLLGGQAEEPQDMLPAQAERRQFLIRLGVGTAAITVVGAGLATIVRSRIDAGDGTAADSPGDPVPASSGAVTGTVDGPVTEFPNADDPLEPAPGTRPEYTPLEDHYRIDINSRPPRIDGAAWRLKITGMVDRPLELTVADLMASYEPVSRFVTLACISNRVGGDLTSTTLWTGASLKHVLADAGVQPGARFVRVYAEDGFHETVSLDHINRDERIMLAYHWDGRPLLEEHGFPLRIYIPDVYGMKQPKWIAELELVEFDEPGYWVVRNWDEVARMNTTSVIDTVAVDSVYEQDGQMLVPIGGIAHAGARGISKVEVRVDDGEWVEARLRAPLSDTTWAIWRYDWAFTEGAHTFYVRCTDGDGSPQSELVNDTFPSGATGIHRVRQTL
jgi:DMSO/TMAO reductase YedYZ molybdopterin-dependent catalytic subunit